MDTEAEQVAGVMNAIFDSIPDGIIIESIARTLWLCNTTFCEMFEMPRAARDLVGLDCREAARKASAAFVDPKSFVAGIEEHVQKKSPVLDEGLLMLDGRRLRRDFVPVHFSDGATFGFLWRYREDRS